MDANNEITTIEKLTQRKIYIHTWRDYFHHAVLICIIISYSCCHAWSRFRCYEC